MEAFLKQTAALGVMVSMCRLLLPQGRVRDAGGLALSLITMLLLLTSLCRLFGAVTGGAPVSEEAIFREMSTLDGAVFGAQEERALQAFADQAAISVSRILSAEGYAVAPRVFVSREGKIASIELDCEYDIGIARAISNFIGVPVDRIAFLSADGL